MCEGARNETHQAAEGTLMAKPVKKPNDNLWVCHECELVGDSAGATRHVETTNHPVEEVPAEETRRIRALWREEGRSQQDGSRRWGLDIDPHILHQMMAR